MNRNYVNNWFLTYTSPFIENEENNHVYDMLLMKIRHSFRVASNITRIAKSEGIIDDLSLYTSHSLGLLHDVGRFEQFKQYKTFLDSVSVDHGDLGVKILSKEFNDSSLPDKYMELILNGVKYHNKRDIPNSLDSTTKKWVKLIRDADKIDIYKVIQNRIDCGTIFDMYPDHEITDKISQPLLEEVRATKKGTYTSARSLQDFRLIQLTWGVDLNYRFSVQYLINNGTFDKICEELKPYQIDDIVEMLMDSIYEKLKR